MADFILDCSYDEENNDWFIDYIFRAESKLAKQKFGDCKLGSLQISRENSVADFLQRKYELNSSSIAVLSYIERNKTCDRREELRGIGMNMLCSIISAFKKDVDYIYLIATSNNLENLISFYKKFGFVSVDENNPEHMIAKLKDISDNCMILKKGKIPVLYNLN